MFACKPVATAICLVALTAGAALVACSSTEEDPPGGPGGGGPGTETPVPGAPTAPGPGPGPGPSPGPNLPPAAAGFPKAFDEGATYATTVYVAPNGSDTTGTGAAASPYATVRRALQGAAAGTDVVLRPGTHAAPGAIGSPQGTATAPIRIRGEAGAIINASGGTVGLAMSDPRYVVLQDLIVENSPVHGMNIDDGSTYATPGEWLVLRRVTFRNIGAGDNHDCLKLSGINRFYVTESDFSGCNAGEAIDMVGCHDGFITGNRVHDTPGSGFQTKGGSKNVVIHGNVFRNVAVHAINLGGSTGDPYVRPLNAPFEGEQIQALSNVIVASGQAAIDFQGCGTCVAANNTIVNPSRWVARILPGARDTSTVPGRDGFFINNVIYYQGADVRSIVNVGPNTQPQTFTFSHNLYFAAAGTGFNGTHAGTGIPNETSSTFQANPQLSNLAMQDFKLLPTSPARAKGRALPAGALFDFERQAPSTPPDLGAFRIP
jgi:hypothetical protein